MMWFLLVFWCCLFLATPANSNGANVESMSWNGNFGGQGFVDVPSPSKPHSYCSYFSNRSPQPAPELRNCSWYKRESCCRQVELDAIFKHIKPIQGANEKCQKMLNYMICWVCDPNQHMFYSSSKQTLTFCESFCSVILDTCQDAVYKASLMKFFYANGREFCKSHNFHVPDYNNQSCFSAGGAQGNMADWQNGAPLTLVWRFDVVMAGLILILSNTLTMLRISC